MSVCLWLYVRSYTMRMLRIVLPSVACLAVSHFPVSTHKRLIPVAMRSKAWVWSRSLAVIAVASLSWVHLCLYLVSVVCCQVDVSASGRSLVQRIPTREDVSECDLGASWMRRSWFLLLFYWSSVVNAPNVLQPYWLIVLPLDIPDLTAILLLWGPSGQRWRCLWTFLFSNVPTFVTSRLQEILATKRGTTWARNGRWILPENARLPRKIQGSFTCRKSTTWDRRLYFPSEGFFSPWKIQRLRPGLNPRTWVPKASTLPLDHRSR